MKLRLSDRRVGHEPVYKSECGCYRAYWSGAWVLEFALPGAEWAAITQREWFGEVEEAAQQHENKVKGRTPNDVVTTYKGQEVARLSISEWEEVDSVAIHVRLKGAT